MKRGGITDKLDGLCYKNVLATYTHTHALGTPEWTSGMIKMAEEYKRQEVVNPESAVEGMYDRHMCLKTFTKQRDFLLRRLCLSFGNIKLSLQKWHVITIYFALTSSHAGLSAPLRCDFSYSDRPVNLASVQPQPSYVMWLFQPVRLS